MPNPGHARAGKTRRRGPVPGFGGRPWTQAEIDMAVALRKCGKTLNEIAAALGVSRSRVHDRLTRFHREELHGVKETRPCIGCKQQFEQQHKQNWMCPACLVRASRMA